MFKTFLFTATFLRKRMWLCGADKCFTTFSSFWFQPQSYDTSNQPQSFRRMSLYRNTCSRRFSSLQPSFGKKSGFGALISVLQHLVHFGSKLKATIHLIKLNQFEQCRSVRIHVQ